MIIDKYSIEIFDFELPTRDNDSCIELSKITREKRWVQMIFLIVRLRAFHRLGEMVDDDQISLKFDLSRRETGSSVELWNNKRKRALQMMFFIVLNRAVGSVRENRWWRSTRMELRFLISNDRQGETIRMSNSSITREESGVQKIFLILFVRAVDQPVEIVNVDRELLNFELALNHFFFWTIN